MTMHKPDFSRVVKAMRFQEPDRVPLMDGHVAYEIMGRFLGREVSESDVSSQVEFFRRAGYDYVPVPVTMLQPGKVTADSRISRVIRERYLKEGEDDDRQLWNIERKAYIHTEEDLDAFPWDEAAQLDMDRFHEVRSLLPEGMKIIASTGKIFTLSWLLMGYENFCIQLMLNPGFTKRVIDTVGAIQLDALKQALEYDEVGGIWFLDDIAYNTGLMISPDDLRTYLFPWYRKFLEACGRDGRIKIYHSDGVLDDVLEDIISIGFDALHPIDPTCVDIEEMNRRVGGRITLIGNIPNELLHSGTPQEVAKLVKRRLKVLAPGGGYCLGSGNSVPEWSSMENYRAMIDTLMEFGTYPISISEDEL